MITGSRRLQWHLAVYLLKMTDFASRTSVLGVRVVRLDSRHTLHSWAHPHLLGKVLVIAPESYFRLVEFHPFQCLLPSGRLNPSSVAGSSSSVPKSGLALQLSEERLSTQSSLWEKFLPKLHFRRAVCNSFPFRYVINKLFFFLEQFVLFQCAVVTLVCSCLCGKWLLCRNGVCRTVFIL